MAAKGKRAAGTKRTAAPKGKGPARGRTRSKGGGKRAARPPADLLEPWDQQEGETGPAFAAFTTYRDLGPEDRSIRAVGRIRDKTRTHIGDWSVRWRWVERAKAWDLHQDRIRQRELEAEQVEASRRHAQTVARSLSATDRLVEAFLKRIDTKAGKEALEKLSAEDLATLAIQAARVQPRLIPAERLPLGLSTTNAGGHDGGPLDDADARAATQSDEQLRAFLLGAETAKALQENGE